MTYNPVEFNMDRNLQWWSVIGYTKSADIKETLNDKKITYILHNLSEKWYSNVLLTYSELNANKKSN